MIMIQKLCFDGCSDLAINLYKKAFDCTIRSLLHYKDAVQNGWETPCPEKDDKVYHSEVMFGPQEVRFSDLSSTEEIELTKRMEHLIGFDTEEEVEKAFSILAENGEIIEPLNHPPYMVVIGTVKDQFGLVWTLMCDYK